MKLKMAVHRLLIVFIFVFIVEEPATAVTHVSHLQLRQEWPQSICVVQKTSNHGHKCLKINKNITAWTVHGLWAEDAQYKRVENCPNKHHFEPSVLAPIKSELLRYWPNLFRRSDKFWHHEWKTHGTCIAGHIAGVKNVLGYFETTLKLYKKYDLYTLLKRQDIMPRDDIPYPYHKIGAALAGMFVGCHCIKSKQYLISAEICMSTNFTEIRCPEKKSVCRNNEPVYYPTIKH